jgi:malic enzyme
VLVEHLEEFLPIVYTPTVGRACQEFSHILRDPRGVWIDPTDVTRIPQRLADAARGDVRLIVVTDNERILGLGDQGAGGMPIPIGKLALYTASAGIHPAFTLPVSLDVGTDNQHLLEDPLYVGWRSPRLRGPAYDAVVEAFVAGVREVFPRAVLQWEDFKQHNAIRLLDRYRDRITSFNDDIQGTGAVVLAGIVAGLRAVGTPFDRTRVVIAGAGAAGIGIARAIAAAMRDAGMTDEAIRRAIALVDSRGLLHEGRTDLEADKRPHAWPTAWLADGGHRGGDLPATGGLIDLGTVVKAVRPDILIGTTAVPGSFTESMIRAIAETVARPIVMPLSNPTANTEAVPSDILAWSDGRAFVAAGSPFDPVRLPDGERVIGQANNVYVFPGVGLGAIVAEARGVPDVVFVRAAETLATMVAPERIAAGALYPPVGELRRVARAIAIAVVATLRDAGMGREIPDEAIETTVDAAIWWPAYRPYRPA